jgi:hypothetical protein
MAHLMTDPGVLAGRIDRVRNALAQRAPHQPVDIDIRVAASVTHLGLVARLLAPALGLSALGVARPSLSLESCWWRDELGGPYPLSVAPDPATAAALPCGEMTVDGSAVEAITVVMLQRFPVSPRVLWGNVGSAINSAAQMISAARPDLGRSARRAADALLRDPRIDDGTLTVGPGYRRRSCCLIYRISYGRNEFCGDCVLSSGCD